jgi:hypothetical protein
MHSGGGGNVQYKCDWPLTSVSLSSEKYSMISHGLAHMEGTELAGLVSRPLALGSGSSRPDGW